MSLQNQGHSSIDSQRNPGEMPEHVTVGWILHHVPIQTIWAIVAGQIAILGAAFGSGYHQGQRSADQPLGRHYRHDAPAELLAGAADIEIVSESLYQGSQTRSVSVPLVILAGEARLLRKASLVSDSIYPPVTVETGQLRLSDVFPSQVAVDSANPRASVRLEVDYSNLLFSADWVRKQGRARRRAGELMARLHFIDRGKERTLDVNLPVYVTDQQMVKIDSDYRPWVSDTGDN